MICVKCRKEILDGSVYCNFCGHKQSTPIKPKPLKRANGMGNVTKLTDRRRRPWRARMTVNGRQVIIGHYERKTDALAALERLTLSGGLPQFFGITVAEVREQWMEKHYPSIGSSGVGSYETAWEYFPAELRNMKMENVKTAHLQSVIDMAVEMGKSQSTCEKIKQLESQLCKWAMENDIINKNYAQFVKINAKKPDPREPFTKQELLRIFAYFKKTRDRVLLCPFILCMFRVFNYQYFNHLIIYVLLYFFRPALCLISLLTIGPLLIHTLSGPQAFFRNLSSGHQLSFTVMPRLPSSV